MTASMMKRLALIPFFAVASVACGGASAGGIPDDCEVRVDGVCYASDTEGCEAAGCPAGRCTILESYPGQVECEEEAPSAEVVTGDEGVVAQGEPCDESTECGEGLFCHGPEGCDVSWTCQPARPCTRDLVQYCGCDGETFSGSGTCPTRPFATRGPCAE